MCGCEPNKIVGPRLIAVSSLAKCNALDAGRESKETCALLEVVPIETRAKKRQRVEGEGPVWDQEVWLHGTDVVLQVVADGKVCLHRDSHLLQRVGSVECK